ncbi:MAG: hypothetical protein ACLSVD_10905 [Eggerthellaceae bacterium]
MRVCHGRGVRPDRLLVDTEQQAGETQKPAEEQAKSESHEAVELQLFAANSLSKAMDACRAVHAGSYLGDVKDTQYLSSGELNEQLAGGAYADVDLRLGGQDGRCVEGLCRRATARHVQNDLVMVAGVDSELAAKYADQSFTLTTLPPALHSGCGRCLEPAGNYQSGAFHRRLLHRRRWQDRQGQRRHRRLYDGTPLEAR